MRQRSFSPVFGMFVSLVAVLAAATPAPASSARAAAPCRLAARAPVLVDGEVVGSGGVRCHRAHRANVQVTVQLFTGGQWQSFADLFDGNVRLRARKAKTFRTARTKCTGLGNLPMRTRLRVSTSHRRLTDTTPSRELAGCGIHRIHHGS